VFNLSKESHTITITGDADLSFGGQAALDGKTLTLDGNGFAYLSHGAKITLKA